MRKWKRKALSAEELENLLHIPTTVAEAQQILKRNTGLLDALERKDYAYTGNAGCPHCGDHACTECAWFLYGSAGCFDGMFGGLSVLSRTGVCYGVDSESLFLPEASIDRTRALRRARIFLRGHVEWAEAVISRGGVPWPADDPGYEAWCRRHSCRS